MKPISIPSVESEWRKHEGTLDPPRSPMTSRELLAAGRRSIERKESFFAGAHAILRLLHEMEDLGEDAGADVLVMLERESRIFVAARLRARIQKGTLSPEAIRLVEGAELVGGPQ